MGPKGLLLLVSWTEKGGLRAPNSRLLTLTQTLRAAGPCPHHSCLADLGTESQENAPGAWVEVRVVWGGGKMGRETEAQGRGQALQDQPCILPGMPPRAQLCPRWRIGSVHLPRAPAFRGA